MDINYFPLTPTDFSNGIYYIPLDVSTIIPNTKYQIEFIYDRGPHRIEIDGVELLQDDVIIWADNHWGWSGNLKENHFYYLNVPSNIDSNMKYTIKCKFTKNINTEFWGKICLSVNKHDIKKTNLAEILNVYINNFNRLDTTRQLVKDLLNLGINKENIIIIDNASTYPPLLDWYKTECPCKIFKLEQNIGHTAFKKLWDENKITKPKGFYIYTDSDINLPNIPSDLFDVLMDVLIKCKVSKVGTALRIDDLPDSFPRKNEVVSWEKQFWQKRADYKLEAYIAAIDTTFALYKPNHPPECDTNAIRVAGDYQAKHCPWYYSKDLPEDEKFFRE